MVSKRPEDENHFGGKWSVEKLNCISDYLDAYLTALSHQSQFAFWYIDAFSGDGVQRLKEEAEIADLDDIPSEYEQEVDCIVRGSAMRALEVTRAKELEEKRGFDHFIFIELDQMKIDILRDRVSEMYPELLGRCEFVRGDVNVELPRILSSVDWESGVRAVCFIDPCATQTDWSTIEAFRSTCCDTWLLFPISAIIRMLPANKQPTDGLQRSLNRIFGDDGWKSLYHDDHAFQPSIFSLIEEEEPKWRRERGIAGLSEYYRLRLESAFPAVFGPGTLKMSGNSPLFQLYAFVPNSNKRAQEIAGKIAKFLIERIERDEGSK